MKTPSPEIFYESDHFPIIIKRPGQNTYPTGPRRYNFSRANWKEYMNCTILKTPEPATCPNKRVAVLENTMNAAAEKCIPSVNMDPNQQPKIPWWNGLCDDAKREKKRASKRYYRTKLQTDWFEYQKCRARLRQVIRQARRQTWKAYVSTINTETTTAEIWKKVKKISGRYKAHNLPVLENEQQTRTSDPQKVAEILSDSLAKYLNGSLYSEEFQRIRTLALNEELNFSSANDEYYNQPLTMQEFRTSLKECSETSPGEDNISYSMIKNSHPTTLCYLLDTFNEVWKSGTLPDAWRRAIKISIKKSGKTGFDPKHYRPISLTCCMCKLMERIVAKRLSWLIEKNNILSPHQYGFRKGRSTLDPLLKLEHDIKDAFTRKHMVLAVFFDLEKAYDTTWKRGILNKLHTAGIRGHLPSFIANFLSKRTFKVRIGKNLSQPREQMEGVPQGSVLACLCFALALNGLKDAMPPDIQYSIYVDDLVIYCEGGYIPSLERRIQHATNTISSWMTKHGYRFSVEKTKIMLFRSRGKRDDPQITLYGSPIMVADELKYLGLTLDPRLTWTSHIRNLKRICQPAISVLSCLSHLTWGACRETLRYIYQTIVLPKINYGAQIYGSTPNKKLKALEPIQNKCLRLISGAFRSSPTQSLQADTNVMPLERQRDLHIGELFFRLLRNPDSPTSDTILKARTAEENWAFTKASKLLIEEANLQSIIIQPSNCENFPPWAITLPNICQRQSMNEDCPFDRGKAQNFLEHLTSHQNTTPVYTDGSKSTEGVGSAVVLPTLGMSNTVSLPKAASIFTAEAYAIILSLEMIQKLPPREYTIFSDSKSVLQALEQYSPKNNMIRNAQDYIHHIQNNLKSKINLCWTPAHVGIKGNEQADAMAKQAKTLPIKNVYIPYSDIKPIIKQTVLKRWQQTWDEQRQNKLHMIKPTLKKWESSSQKRRKDEVALCRLRIGHCNFTHIHLMTKQLPPQCCGETQTTMHALVECPATER